MLSAPRQVCRLQVQRLQRGQTLASHSREIVQKLLQRFAFALFDLRKAVKRIEWPRLAVLKYGPRTRHPVSTVCKNQMTNDVERAPGIFALIAMHPEVG